MGLQAGRSVFAIVTVDQSFAFKPMALRALKTASLSPPKHPSLLHLSHFRFSPTSAPHPTTLLPSTLLHTTNSDSDVAQQLSAAFSRPRQLPPDDAHLQNLARNLTPAIVEATLKGFKGWASAHRFFSWAAEQDGFAHNRYTYNAMASILSQAQQKSQLRILAQEVVNAACPMSAGGLGFLIRCLGSVGLIDEAQYLFDNAERLNCFPNVYTYNCLLECLAKASRVELVEIRVKEMVDSRINPDKFTMTPILKAYCNAGKLKEALRVFDWICENGLIDDYMFTVLVMTFSKLGEIDKAFELTERMDSLGVRLNEKTFCSLIHGFTKCMSVDKALVLFDRMKGLGLNGDLALYSVLIKGFCERKDLDKALDLYQEMKEIGIFPDVTVVAQMISTFCGDGKLVTAERILEENGENLDADAMVSVYNAVLQGLVNHGDVDKALFLIRAMMKSHEVHIAEEKAEQSHITILTETQTSDFFRLKKAILPNAASFNIVIDGLSKIEKLDMALELFHDMARIGCTGNVLIYNNLIHQLCNADRLDESYELFQEMKVSGFEPTHFTYNSFFECLCKREDVSGAVDVAIQMRDNGHEPWIKHCTMLVKRLCMKGRAMEACSFLNDMVHVGFVANVIAYSTVIDGLFKSGEMDQALKLFHDMSANECLPDMVAHNITIRGLCKAGRTVEAQDILNKMLDKGLVPSVVTYNLIIDGLCKGNKVDLALVCFSRMADGGLVPTVVTYTTLIDGLCNASRPDDALVLWNEMMEKGCAPNNITYMALINGLCKCGREEAALAYVCEMEKKELEADAFIYVSLINSFVSKGNTTSGFDVLNKMICKSKFPSLTDKNHQLLIHALRKLCEDEKTSSYVRDLISEGSIPMIHSVNDLGVDIKEM
ncbi:hypothetical protein ACLOJK_023941 [Asimina triloba]